MYFDAHKLTFSIQARTLRIGVLYGKLSSLYRLAKQQNKFVNYLKARNDIAAVIIDKGVLSKISSFNPIKKEDLVAMLGEKAVQDFLAYSYAKEKILLNPEQPLTIESIKKLHETLLPGENSDWRKSKREFRKTISENGILKQIIFEVKSPPSEIITKLEEFMQWFNQVRAQENPLILAAISHFKMVEIHPFDDGNGRVARIVEQLALRASGVFSEPILFTESYFLKNIERYYDLIESSINSGDFTGWIEYYTEAVLSSLVEASQLLKDITFGAIDIERNVFIELSDLENQVLELMSSANSRSPTEIARKLGYSRQNIYRVIWDLEAKKLL